MGGLTLVFSPISIPERSPLSRLVDERRYFVIRVATVTAVVVLLRLAIVYDSSFLGLNLFTTLGSRIFLVYFVFRFSRALADPVWLTVVWCLFILFGLNLIPIIGTLVTAHLRIQELKKSSH